MLTSNKLHNTKKSLSELISESIIDKITNQELLPGEKIPNEFELAEMLDVGRGTIREAIKLLVSRNILIIEHGKGTFVSEQPGQVEDPFGFRFIDDKLALAKDLWELRALIEPEFASLTAIRATLDQKNRINSFARKVKYAIIKNKAFLFEDIQFHCEIAKSSGNQAIRHITPLLKESISLNYELDVHIMSNDDIIITHQEIVDAINQSDPQKAKIAMKKHMDRSIENITNSYK